MTIKDRGGDGDSEPGMPETKQPRHSSLSTVTKHCSNVTNHLFCDGKSRGQKGVFCDSLLGSRGVFS